MRAAEWISVAFYLLLIAAAPLARLTNPRRLGVLAIGGAGLLTAWLLRFVPNSLLRDLLPGVLLTLGYWQSGRFFTGPNPRVQAWLRSVDERWFPWVLRLTSSLPERRALSAYLELSYLAFYPLMPLGILILYRTGRKDLADQYWQVVLLSVYFCHACTVLLPSLPPRLVEGEEENRSRRSGLRAASSWLLDHGSITANTFPSGHAAAGFAVALMLLKPVPVAGIACLWIAASIAVSTAVLRYHYAVDAVFGAAVAVVAFAWLG